MGWPWTRYSVNLEGGQSTWKGKWGCCGSRVGLRPLRFKAGCSGCPVLGYLLFLVSYCRMFLMK